jgi:hypothetical protein
MRIPVIVREIALTIALAVLGVLAEFLRPATNTRR